MKRKFVGRLIMPLRVADDGEICTENGVITSVGEYDKSTDIQFGEVKKTDGWFAPGYVDIHTHGANGYDFCDGTEEAFLGAAECHYKNGTTTLLPTSLTCPDSQLFAFFGAYEKIKGRKGGFSDMPGLHLEGPYFSKQFKGAQDESSLALPLPEHYLPILERYGNDILRWSSAPELEGAFGLGRELRKRGICCAIAHSAADEATVVRAYENGYTHLTHFYCAMSGMQRRNAYKYPGIIECGYIYDAFTVEVIADGHHVPDSFLKLIYRNIGPARTALVSDSLRVAGLPDGEYTIGSAESGRKILKDRGVAFLPDRSAFAGSAVTVSALVKNMIERAGATLPDAVRMATLTPSLICGLEKKGRLAEGCDADIIELDEDINVASVYNSK